MTKSTASRNWRKPVGRRDQAWIPPEPLHHVTIIQLQATASMHSVKVPVWLKEDHANCYQNKEPTLTHLYLKLGTFPSEDHALVSGLKTGTNTLSILLLSWRLWWRRSIHLHNQYSLFIQIASDYDPQITADTHTVPKQHAKHGWYKSWYFKNKSQKSDFYRWFKSWFKSL